MNKEGTKLIGGLLCACIYGTGVAFLGAPGWAAVLAGIIGYESFQIKFELERRKP